MKLCDVKFILPVLPVVTCSVLPVAGADRGKQPERPNILFIMADEWRGDAVGYMGREPVQTPKYGQACQAECGVPECGEPLSGVVACAGAADDGDVSVANAG